MDGLQVDLEFVVGLVAFVVVALASPVQANLRVARVAPERKGIFIINCLKKSSFFGEM